MTALPAPGDPLTCYLVDASSWARPAWEVAEPTVVAGERVEVTRVFAWKLRRLFEHCDPAFLGIAFDVPGAFTLRRARWSEYKAGRTTPGPEYEAQLDRCAELCALHRIPVWRGSGHEADDWIAAAALRARSFGMRVVIVGRDHDLWQLVTDDGAVVVWDGESADAVGVAEVGARYNGLQPAQLPDFWALAGQGDEAPGVPGIGEVTATALVLKRAGLEDVLRKWPWEKPRVGTALRDGVDLARLSRELVVLRGDAPLEVLPSDLQVGWGAGEARTLRDLARRLGLRALEVVQAQDRLPIDERILAAWLAQEGAAE